MKKFLLLLLFPVISNAQTSVYKPFPEDTAVWIYDNFAQPPSCGPYCYSDVIRMCGDTLIGNNSYSKLYIQGIYFLSCPNYNVLSANQYMGCVRQDIINKKVYYRPASMSADTLLYDFDLNIGDTLPATYLQNYLASPTIVTSFDSVLISGQYHKAFVFNNSNLQIGLSGYLIEGVGSSCFLNMLFDFFEGGPQLNYFNQNSIPYTISGNSCPAFTACLAPVLSVREDANNFIFQISPNPSSGIFTVSSIEEITAIEIYNTLGEKVFSLPLGGGQCPVGIGPASAPQGGGETSINLSTQPKGIYFVKVQGREKISTHKIIIQ